MRVGELARRTGTTVRALRYYESAGLVVPRRLSNGYREYDPIAERLVAQIRELMALGLTVEALDARLDAAATQVVPGSPAEGADPAALVGVRLPSLSFHGTDGRPVDLGALGAGRSVIFVYPLTGRPGVDLPNGLLEIHGARGSTEQAAWFRDHHAT
ncbi:MerR family transcriptional regulator [Micromonospora ureilytica]|uniref:MerR family transcriptional regulator n=1 Tax=Micromonospora ureilytica TaxID=709868 RepID=UPI002E0F0E4D|nr:MerR family transcriptional regulator [Micromonospora ureilytica]